MVHKWLNAGGQTDKLAHYHNSSLPKCQKSVWKWHFNYTKCALSTFSTKHWLPSWGRHYTSGSICTWILHVCCTPFICFLLNCLTWVLSFKPLFFIPIGAINTVPPVPWRNTKSIWQIRTFIFWFTWNTINNQVKRPLQRKRNGRKLRYWSRSFDRAGRQMTESLL